MIEKLVRFCVRQRVFVLVMVAALVVMGARALIELPIEAFPDVEDVKVQVVTLYPGQAPEEVERAVTQPIEREMAGVARFAGVRSVSMTGLSVVTVTFDEGTDDYFARQQVNEKLGGITQPVGAQTSLGPLSTGVGEIFRYVLKAPAGTSLADLRSLQDWVIRPALRMTPGVADVNTFGGAIREYQIDVDPQRLRKFQVTLDQLNTAIANGNANAGGGLMRRGDESMVIRSVGLVNKLDDLRQIVIASRQGRPILVGDVAEVKAGEKAQFGMVGSNREDNVVEGIVLMLKGGNPTHINTALRERIQVVQRKLPAGIEIVPVYDRTELVHHTVNTVAENLVTGAVLVIAVLVIFLRDWRAAAIVASVIPLALLFAFVLMHAKQVSANLISLGAVDFGIIIDSAVVMVEALMVKLALHKFDTEKNLSLQRLGVLRSTVVELAHPILFSKAIIILAFLPIFTFQRVEGKIFTPVALTLSFALAGALVLTLTVVPMLLSFAIERGGMQETHKAWMDRLQKSYKDLLEFSMMSPKLIFGISALIVSAAIFAGQWLGSEFLPKLDEGNIWLTVSLPTSAALETTKDAERVLRSIALKYSEVERVISQTGRPDDGTDPKGPNNIEMLIDLKPRAEWNFASKDALVSDMAQAMRVIPGIETNFSQVIQDNVEEAMSGSKGEIVVKVIGPNLEILDQKGHELVALLQSIKGATDVDAMRIGGQTELVIQPERTKLARLGIAISDINTLITEALSGAGISSFYEADRRFDIVVRLAKPYRQGIDDIANLQVGIPNSNVGNTSATVALGDIARIEAHHGASRIMHEDGTRMLAVKLNLIGRDQGSFVSEAQKRVRSVITLPAGYTITWGGQFENSQRATKRLAVIIPITALMIFTLLFWAFRSVRLAVLVMMMVPFTAIGGLGVLALAHLHLSVSAAVGFIAVAGISVQNGVIMVEEVMNFSKRGVIDKLAVIEGAVLRLRPILMTALMAGLGLLPAALSHGIGSETQRPFACVIVGGILSGTLFTLLLLPVALLRFGRLQSSDDDVSPFASS